MYSIAENYRGTAVVLLAFADCVDAVGATTHHIKKLQSVLGLLNFYAGCR